MNGCACDLFVNFVYTMRTGMVYIVYVKETTTPTGWKCHPKATASMNDEKNLIPQGRLQLAQKYHYT